MTGIPTTGLDSFNINDFNSGTQVEGYDDVWIKDGKLYIGDGFSSDDELILSEIEAQYGDITEVILDDDDGNTGHVNIDASIDKLYIDNDFNTENEDGISGQAVANISISNQDDELDIDVSMDSVIRTNVSTDDVGTKLDINIDDSDINFTGNSYQTQHLATGDENANNLDAHNFTTLNTNGEVTISGNMEQNSFGQIGQSFKINGEIPTWMQTAGLIASADQIPTTRNYTHTGEGQPDLADVFPQGSTPGEVVALRNEEGEILGMYVNDGMNAHYFPADDSNGLSSDGMTIMTQTDANGSMFAVSENQGLTPDGVTIINSQPAGGCDPDNTFTINVNSGNTNIETFRTEQNIDIDISTTVGNLDGGNGDMTGDGFIVQNNLFVNTADGATVEMNNDNHTQDLQMSITGSDQRVQMKFDGGNTIMKNGEEIITDNQSAEITVNGNMSADQLNIENLNNVDTDDITFNSTGNLTATADVIFSAEMLMDAIFTLLQTRASAEEMSQEEVREHLEDSGYTDQASTDDAIGQIFGDATSLPVSEIKSNISSITGISQTGNGAGAAS
jgi:hypothetical protein